MDGLSLSAAVTELGALCGARVEKVQQPERDELLLALHSSAGSKKLLISASPENCRITIADEKKVSPVEAPAFLMLMRKYLTGAKITCIEQPMGDRIVRIAFEAYSELHDAVTLTLVCELMGRCSNIILLDGEENIIDSIRRVPPSVSTARMVLPKAKYEYPPSKQKRVAREASASDFAEALISGAKPETALSESFYGLSPAVARRLLVSLGYPDCGAEEAGRRLKAFYERLFTGDFSPCIVMANGSSVCPLPFLPRGGEDYRQYPTMSEAVNDFYRLRTAEESTKRRTAQYERAIKTAMQKLERKLAIYAEAITGEEEIERLRIYGELLTASLYELTGRASSAFVTDYYSDPPKKVEIPLDPLYSAADNAQRYYTKYRKAKLAREHALEMRGSVTDELSYLEGLLYTLGCCEGEAELNELKEELISGRYIKDSEKRASGRRTASPKLPQSKPYVYISRDGIKILVGKNNRQNDRLTLHTALPDETWLHTKDVHGSHVIIRHSGEAPDDTLFDAAMLAAYYSKARGSASVPVDCAPVKYVKKPAQAAPGAVIYTHQRTVFVTPDAEYIMKLKREM